MQKPAIKTGSYIGDPNGNRSAFSRPETSSLKTSFQEKVSLQNATGILHRIASLQNMFSLDETTNLKTPPIGDVHKLVSLSGTGSKQLLETLIEFDEKLKELGVDSFVVVEKFL